MALIVVLDIETLQAPREEWEKLVGLTPESRDPAGAQFADLFSRADAEAQRLRDDEAYERSSFDGTFSRIACIGTLWFSNEMEPRGAVCWFGDSEAAILRGFWSKVGENRPSLFVTHNGLGFDLPFIKKRSIIHQIKPSVDISLARFRTEPVFDTMAVWSNWDNRGWVKLDVLARALGVETKSGSGDQVAGMWAKGRWKEVAQYCLQDTYVTYACFCRMKFRQPLSREVVLLHQELVEVK